MSDVRRRFVRLSIFLLPAFLVLAALHFLRSDLRDAVPNFLNPGYRRDGHTFIVRGKDRADKLGAWTRDAIAKLQENGRIYGFKGPKSGFRVEVRSEPGPSECDPGSNRILIRGIPDDAPADDIKPDLSRLIARAMLRQGAPDADFSPWFETGVSWYFEGTPKGSRKDPLIAQAARNQPPTLADALSARHGANFEAVSHSIVAFLHESFGADTIARYASIEREAGPVPAGSFERVFGPDAEKDWRDFLERRRKGS